MSKLVIIGGISFSGKSFLIKKILQGEYPLLCKQLGILDLASWDFVLASDFKNLDLSKIDQLVVHFDLYAQRSEVNAFRNIHDII